MTKYPALVAKLAHCFDAWIVGSAAIEGATKPRDYDVVVSPANWRQAVQLLPADAKMNRMGGWKCISEGAEVDVWPEDLSTVLSNALTKVAFHPRTGRRFLVQSPGGTTL